MKLRAVIAEDELPAIAKLRKLLSAIPDVEVVGEARSGRVATELIRSLRPDVAFLDIKMPGGDGLTAMSELPDPPKIVFVTAHAQHAALAYERRVSDYILKPYTASRLQQVVEQIRNQLRLERFGELVRGPSKIAPAPAADVEHRLLVKIGSEVNVVAANEIECVFSESNYLHLMTATRKYFVRGVISAVERMLPGPKFLRVHRTAVVNLDHIRAISLAPREVITVTGFRIPVSRACLPRLLESVDRLGLPSLGKRN